MSNVINGLGGAAVLPNGYNLNIKSWAGIFNNSISNTTEVGDYWQDHESDEGSFTATIIGQMIKSDLPLPATSGMPENLVGDYTLQAFNGCSYSFTATIVNWQGNRNNSSSAVSVTVVAKGKVTVSEGTWGDNAVQDISEDPSGLTPPPDTTGDNNN